MKNTDEQSTRWEGRLIEFAEVQKLPEEDGMASSSLPCLPDETSPLVLPHWNNVTVCNLWSILIAGAFTLTI
jgi:hypothetical protein